MKTIISCLLSFWTAISFTQNTEIPEPILPSKEELSADSRQIHNETFDIQFLIRVLPDNGWFLNLHKNSSYEYLHWCGFSDTKTLLERGTYYIENNKLILQYLNEIPELANQNFYIFSTKDKNIENHIYLDCAEYMSEIICLYH